MPIQDEDKDNMIDDIQANQETKIAKSNSIIEIDDEENVIKDSHIQKNDEKDKESSPSKLNYTIANKMVEPLVRRFSASASIIFK